VTDWKEQQSLNAWCLAVQNTNFYTLFTRYYKSAYFDIEETLFLTSVKENNWAKNFTGWQCNIVCPIAN